MMESVEIIVQLDPRLAASVRGDAGSTDESTSLEAAFGALGIELEPLFPGIEDDDMACQFRALVDHDVPDDALAGLRDRPGVLAAYIKAPGAPPTGC